MPRQSTLKKIKKGKNTYWYATIRRKERLFGNVKTTSRAQAQELFALALAQRSEPTPITSSRRVTTVAQLYDDYIDWVEANLSDDSLRCKTSNLPMFCQWTPTGSRQAIKDMPVTAVTVDHLIEYIEARQDDNEDLAAKTLWHYINDVKAMWNWGGGRNRKRPIAGHMPKSHDPFCDVQRPTPDQINLTADSLPTDEEVDQLIRRAKYEGFQPILKTIHLTGARPGEMCNAKVKHFQPNTKTMIFYHHKNDERRTGEKATPRVVALSEAALALVQEGCDSKKPDDPIFNGPMGAAWTRDRLGKKFREARKALGVRPHIRLYSFRHLYCSEALQNGFSIHQVAAAVGTSPDMIAKTYGHFYVKDLVTMADEMDACRSRRKAAKKKSP